MTQAALQIARDEPVLFASDLHLSVQTQATLEDALDQIARHSQDAAHLFLLGDLFELWVGDDGADAIAERFASMLSTVANSGTRVWMMRGNRDFLIDVPVPGFGGGAFSQRCGATLLSDPFPVSLHGEAALLAHGDALCTDDLVYQQWRQTCRNPAWQQGLLARSLAERFAIGRTARESSEAGKREMAGALMDVNQSAVDVAMDAAGASLLIHGHTHRPDVHRWQHRGTTRTRVVLTDWDASADRGHLLRWENGAPKAIARSTQSTRQISRPGG
jgi:UDP-2,3-diacylglucosamine hydrolase